MNGWISIYRKIQEHWVWQDEKYLKWWLTIILNVNHEPKKFPVGNEVLICNPGQSFRSIEQWTAMFLCSKKTTVKFFEMLKNDDMIQCETVGKGNRRKHLLTVINWDEYQKKETENSPSRKPECSVNGNPNVTPNNKDNNVNKENNINSENFKLFREVVSLFDEKSIREKKWLECYDKLIRIDNYTEETILKIVKHFREDSFWSSNFISLLKLRNSNPEGVKYIDVFAEKLKNVKSQNNGNKSGKQEPEIGDSDRYARAAGKKVY